MTAPKLLEVSALQSGYDASQVLFDMQLSVEAGQCVTLLGRNGMGKSTTIKCIMGLLPVWKGQIAWRGQPMQNQAPYRMARVGLGYVPEGRQVFPNLSVRENLVATAANRRREAHPWTLEKVYALFPRLAERASNFGNQLSGGEQQMLAVARALMTNPELLILDEATEGLSPLVRQEIWEALAGLKAAGMAILVVDKNLGPLLRLGDRHHIIEKGQFIWSGTSDAFVADPTLKSRYLLT
jgi:branched-chain amino acid transport system ATP-binding protein